MEYIQGELFPTIQEGDLVKVIPQKERDPNEGLTGVVECRYNATDWIVNFYDEQNFVAWDTYSDDELELIEDKA